VHQHLHLADRHDQPLSVALRVAEPAPVERLRQRPRGAVANEQAVENVDAIDQSGCRVPRQVSAKALHVG